MYTNISVTQQHMLQHAPTHTYMNKYMCMSSNKYPKIMYSDVNVIEVINQHVCFPCVIY